MESFKSIKSESPIQLSEFFAINSSNSPKIISYDDPILRNTKPSDFYFNQARAKYLLTERSGRVSIRPDESQTKQNLNKTKTDNSNMFKDLTEIIPE